MEKKINFNIIPGPNYKANTFRKFHQLVTFYNSFYIFQKQNPSGKVPKNEKKHPIRASFQHIIIGSHSEKANFRNDPPINRGGK